MKQKIRKIKQWISILLKRNPTNIISQQWLEYSVHNTYPKPTDRSGKWLIFCGRYELDKNWLIIKKLLKQGKLGNRIKSATNKLIKPYRRSNKPICIYTYDYTDWDDVMRIRENLRKAGFEKRIPYKTDEDTNNGVYYHLGDRNISKYYE